MAAVSVSHDAGLDRGDLEIRDAGDEKIYLENMGRVAPAFVFGGTEISLV